jgi:hypothetical protein
MKILYIIDIPYLKESGVFQKVLNQTKYWKTKENDFQIFSIHTGTFFDGSNYSSKNKFKKTNKFETYLRLLKNSKVLYHYLNEISFDVIYSRYLLFTPYLNKIFKKETIILEINGDEYVQYKNRSRLTFLYYYFTRRLIEKNINGAVFISNELRRIYNKRLGKNSVIIANGLELKDIIKNKEFKKNKIVFIGSKHHYWTGLEKVFYLANKMKKLEFHFIGIDGLSTNNIVYHGRLNESKSSKIIESSSLAICSLALYKGGLTEASPLKSRLYLSLGVPILYGYDDTDLSGEEKFFMKIPNNEDQIDIDKFSKFLDYINSNRQLVRNEIAEINKTILTNKNKELNRLKFFKECMVL